jgi:hypothetical protein
VADRCDRIFEISDCLIIQSSTVRKNFPSVGNTEVKVKLSIYLNVKLWRRVGREKAKLRALEFSILDRNVQADAFYVLVLKFTEQSLQYRTVLTYWRSELCIEERICGILSQSNPRSSLRNQSSGASQKIVGQKYSTLLQCSIFCVLLFNCLQDSET